MRVKSANSPPAPSDKGSGGFAGGGKKKHENNNTSSHDKYAFPSLSLKKLAGIELDVDVYVNDLASRQPSKKLSAQIRCCSSLLPSYPLPPFPPNV
jgi:hypothetical protein